MRHRIALRAAAAAVTFAAVQPAAASARHEWNFRVLLDGEPIGTHRFVVTDEGTEKSVRSEADFSVRMLGITVYRYRHEARERWQGDCLVALGASTDDDGKQTSVKGTQDGDRFAIVAMPGVADGETEIRGCAMSYAYWNPALRGRTRLVNPQTGHVDAVAVTPLPPRALDVHGAATPARGLRIAGPGRAIDVWYTPQGDWIGLDATLAQGKTLSYRLP